MAEDIARLARQLAPKKGGLGLRKGKVGAINGDNTIDIKIKVDAVTEMTIPHVACLKSYTFRTVGDSVWFFRFDGNKYLCIGAQG